MDTCPLYLPNAFFGFSSIADKEEVAVIVLDIGSTPVHVVRDVQKSHVFMLLSET